MFVPVYNREDKDLKFSARRIEYYYYTKKTNPKIKLDQTKILKNVQKDIRLVPGLILSRNYKVLFTPDFDIHEITSLKDVPNNIDVYEIVDGTSVYVYHWKGEMRLGTRNAWDTGNITEYQTNKRYIDYFRETLAALNIDESVFDKNEMYAVTFVHPKLHITEEKFRLLSFCGIGEEPAPLFKQGETEGSFVLDDTSPSCLIVDKYGNRYIYMTKERSNALYNIYNNRHFYRKSDVYEHCLIRIMLNWILYTKIDANEIYQMLNTRTKALFLFTKGVLERYIAERSSEKYYGVDVPVYTRMNQEGLIRKISSLKDRSVWEDVCINAFDISMKINTETKE